MKGAPARGWRRTSSRCRRPASRSASGRGRACSRARSRREVCGGRRYPDSHSRHHCKRKDSRGLPHPNPPLEKLPVAAMYLHMRNLSRPSIDRSLCSLPVRCGNRSVAALARTASSTARPRRSIVVFGLVTIPALDHRAAPGGSAAAAARNARPQCPTPAAAAALRRRPRLPARRPEGDPEPDPPCPLGPDARRASPTCRCSSWLRSARP